MKTPEQWAVELSRETGFRVYAEPAKFVVVGGDGYLHACLTIEQVRDTAKRMALEPTHD